jgi:hypothetical protein
MPLPETRSGSGLSIPYLSDRLERRCDHLQVLSRSLTLTGSWQDHLDEMASSLPVVRVKQRGFIRLNTLQRTSQRVWVLSWRMHCQDAKTDNSQSSQHCGDQAFGGFSLDLFHKLVALQAM